MYFSVSINIRILSYSANTFNFKFYCPGKRLRFLTHSFDFISPGSRLKLGGIGIMASQTKIHGGLVALSRAHLDDLYDPETHLMVNGEKSFPVTSFSLSTSAPRIRAR
jgi:hypothetical protein